MTFASSIPWPAVVLLVVTFALIAYVWGAAKTSAYREEQYAQLVGQIARLRTTQRDLYTISGLPVPDLHDDPDPVPGRWERMLDRIRSRKQPLPTIVPEPEPEPEPQRDWRTDTGPIVMPGPATTPDMKVAASVPPPGAMDDDAWRQKSDALYQQMLAEIRGEK